MRRAWRIYHGDGNKNQLMRDGTANMHCMSDIYLAEELSEEYDGVGKGESVKTRVGSEI